MALKEVYSFACEEYHLKKNSRFFNDLPSDIDATESVREIDVSRNYIGPKGIKALLEVVKSCYNLHTLILRDQQLSKEAVLMLCDTLASHPSVRKLDLRQNPITIDGGRHLFDLVQANPRIEQVLLENTEIKDSLITAITARANRNKQHRARIEASSPHRSASSPGRRGQQQQRSGGAAAVNTTTSPNKSDDHHQQLAAIDMDDDDDEETAAIRAKERQEQLQRIGDGTLDASLAREIIQRCPISVHSLLLDEDIHNALSERCEATRCHFLDPDFPPSLESISSVASTDIAMRVKTWKRLVHFDDRGTAMLTMNTNLLDQQQQQEGENYQYPFCIFSESNPPREPVNVAPEFSWFFTSLFSVLHGSELQSSLQALISPPTVNPAGVYCVKFFVDGKWRCVLIDDYIPVGSDGKPALCGTDTKNAFWPILILKAAAKLHGSYRAVQSNLWSTNFTPSSNNASGVLPSNQNHHDDHDAMSSIIASGSQQQQQAASSQQAQQPPRHPTLERPISAATVMSDFSGGVSVSRQLNHAHFDSGAWFQTMMDLHEQKAWLVATSGADNEATSSGGIMPFHAYRIRQIRAVNGNKLVQLHSVHSKRVWIGEWGHSSPLWESNTDVAAALAYRPSSTRGPSAPFWMRYSAFLACFSTVHACTPCLQSYSSMVEGAWVKSTAGGPAFEPTTWWCNPHYRLRLPRPTKVLIALSVPDVRFHSTSVSTMGLHFLKGDGYPLRCEKDLLYATTNYAISNCVTYSAELPEGVLWVVPSTYDEGVHGRFFLRVVSSEPFSFAHENRDDHLRTYQIRCNLADSGEYQNGENNPLFAIQTLPPTVSDFTSSLSTPGNIHNNNQFCRIAVQMHAECENLNVGLLLCKSINRRPDEENLLLPDENNNNNNNNKNLLLLKQQQQNQQQQQQINPFVADRLLGPISDEVIVARSKLIIGKTVHLDAQVPLSTDPYILVPCVLPQHSINVPLQLTVWCSSPRCSVSEVPFWPCMELGIEWTRSGGLQDVAQNPQIELVVRRPRQRFLLHLEVFGVQDPSLILYVVQQARGHESIALPPGHRVPDSAIVCNSQFVRHHTTTCEFEFIASSEPGSLPAHFIILPCLQPPGTSARGTISVSSEWDDFQVSLLPVNTHDG